MAFKKKKKVFINALYGNATLRTVSIQLKLKKGKQPLKPRRHSKMLDSGLLYGRFSDDWSSGGAYHRPLTLAISA